MAKLASQPVTPSAGSVEDNNRLDNLRERYARALSRREEAKAGLIGLTSRNFDQSENLSINRSIKNSGVAASRQRQLEEYLENLRLQRRHKNLQILSHHSDEAEKFASEENILDGVESVTRTIARAKDSDQLVALTATQHHLESLIDNAKTRTANLELAVVKARQQLRLEQSLLEGAKTQSKESRNGEAAGKMALANQRAMEATRDELQKWIGEGLARCEQEMASLPGPEISDLSIGNLEQLEQDNDTLVEIEYERYLEARIQLIQTANALRTPLPDAEIGPSSTNVSKIQSEQKIVPDEQRQKLPLQRAPHLRHKSRISVIKLGEQSGGPDLAKIESVHLPRYHHERLLNTHATHLNVQTGAQDSQLLQSLGFLSHESHLLPTFPLSTMDVSQAKRSIRPRQNQAEIDHLLRSWAFASDTADDVLRENVVKNGEDTREALERANQYLEEIRIMENMKKEVAIDKK